jgi:mono/diheme cytochrome c family protein
MEKTQNNPLGSTAASHGEVEMPRATAWPIALAAGISLAMLGAATNLFFCVVGGVLFAISLVGWIANLLPGEGHGHEAVEEGDLPSAVRVKTDAVTELKPGVVGYRFQLPEKVHPVSAGVRGGIVGGLLMPIPAFIWAISSGHSIWFPVNLLAGLVIPGLTDMPAKEFDQFHPWLLAGAIVMHVTLSIGFGLIGGVILPTLPQIPGGPLLFGGLILPLGWTAANQSLLGIVNPLLADHIDWKWYLVSQLVYGIATSIVIMRSETIPIAPRGHGREGGGPPISPSTAAILLAVCCSLLSGCNNDFESKLPGKPDPKDAFVMPSDVTDFGKLFKYRCASCHGADGTLGPGPPLNDELFVALISEKELSDVISNGRRDTLMPAWAKKQGGPLTDGQVAVLVKGIHERTLAGEKASASQAVFPNAPPLVASANSAGSVESGKQVFAAACAGCHGETGGGAKAAGAINDPDFLALMSDQVLRRYIITGRNDLGMPNFSEKTGRDPNFTPLTSGQVSDLVALLASWRETKPNWDFSKPLIGTK